MNYNICTQAVTRREDLARLTQELERARAQEVAVSTVTAVAAPVKSSSPADAATVVGKDFEGLTQSEARSSKADLDARDPVTEVDPKAVDSRDGGMEASLEVAVAEARRTSKLARHSAKRSREDVELAEEALRLLRKELDGLVEDWVDRRMRLLGGREGWGRVW